MRASFAVIPTHSRPTEFAKCVTAISPQVDQVIAVCHGADALKYAALPNVEIVPYNVTGRANISRMWNLGIDAARAHGSPFDVAILNDDAIPAADWFRTLTTTMRSEGAAGASERRHPGVDKIAGWAFVLDGDYQIRADESLVHWFGDDDIQRQCQSWAFVDGISTPNTLANTTSRGREARRQIELDSTYFLTKWAP